MSEVGYGLRRNFHDHATDRKRLDFYTALGLTIAERNYYCANPVLRSIPAKTTAGQQPCAAAPEPL